MTVSVCFSWESHVPHTYRMLVAYDPAVSSAWCREERATGRDIKVLTYDLAEHALTRVEFYPYDPKAYGEVLPYGEVLQGLYPPCVTLDERFRQPYDFFDLDNLPPLEGETHA